MNFIRWKCGCIQIENEPIYVYFCEGGNLPEYGFSYSDRKCQPPFEVVDKNEKENIIAQIQNHVIQSYHYAKLRRVLKDLVN